MARQKKALMRRLGMGVALALTILLAGYSDAARPDALAPRVLEHSASIRADNALIAEVEVRLSRPGRVFVEYENPRAGKFRTALSESGAKHVVPVLRLRADATYSYAIGVQDADGAVHLGQRGEFKTGSLPSMLAAMRVRASGRSSQPLILTDYNADFRNRYILFWDEAGSIVWYYVHGPLHWCWKGNVNAIKQKRGGNLVYLSRDCSITEITPLGEMVRHLAAGDEAGIPHHDFVLLDDGRILYLITERTIFDNSANGGEAETLVEIDSLGIWDPERGTVQQVWDPRDFWNIASEIQRGGPWEFDGAHDWTHINSVSLGLQGNFILSSRHLQQILSISADFQTIEWKLGGPGSDYGFPNPNDRFSAPHQATQLPNGNILLFDNGTWRPESEGGKYSRAIEFRLDDERGSAAKAWEYRPDPDIFAQAVSGVQRLGNGNTLINFGTREDIDFMPLTFVEADPQGNELFRVETLQFRSDREAKYLPMRYRATGGIGSIHGETMLRAPAARTEAFIPDDRRYWKRMMQRDREQHLKQLRSLYESLVSGALEAPLARSVFDIHLDGEKLTYLKQPCAEKDTQEMFFLHVIPVDGGDLPPDRKQSGFENLDFSFSWSGEFLDGDRCIVQRLLPSYPIDRIRTGQFILDEKQLWQAEFPAAVRSE